MDINDLLSAITPSPQRRAAMGRSVTRLPDTLAGTPVDMANSVLELAHALGIPVTPSEKPVMGSDWIAERIKSVIPSYPTEKGEPTLDMILSAAVPGGAAKLGKVAFSGEQALAQLLKEMPKGPVAGSPAAQRGSVALRDIATSPVGDDEVAQILRVARDRPPVKTMPELADRYPDTALPVSAFDKNKGKFYAGKNLSQEELALQDARHAAQREIDAGDYEPMFDLAKREHVDPANYPEHAGQTIDEAIPKTYPTYAKWQEKYDTPEVRQRLLDAFDRSAADPKAKNWYAMKQLHRAFIDELGPEAGNKAFKDHFANAMAATTGGADPTANLLTSAYGNFLKATGKSLPANAFDFPHPVGGRYVTGNLEMYDKVMNKGKPMTAGEQPKRFNFGGNFMGFDAPTIDEQMMKLFDPSGKLKAPEGDSYGVLQEIINAVAKERGVSPRDFQDVAWAGAKGVEGMPMMQHVNEMIARTAKVTGQSQEEVLRGFIRGNKPMYGIGAAAPLAAQQDDEK